MARRFTWFDLMTTDVAAGLAFYGEVLGYGTQPWDGPMPYTLFTSGGAPMGGAMALPESARAMGAPSHWLGYVSVENVAASLAQAKALGATVYADVTEIPNVGAFAVLADPFGAVFALFHSSDPQGGGPVKAVSWHELMTDDVDKALAFYGALFGWQKTSEMEMGPGEGSYVMFGEGSDPIGGMMRRPPMVPVNAWTYYHHVADVKGTIAKAEARGAKLLHGPMEVPGGDLAANLMDPQGAAFAIHGPGGV